MSLPFQIPETGRRIGYARVSTDRQTLYQHIDALEEAGCDPIFNDAATSAKTKNRPGLQKARAALKPGDVFVVLAIDRAFRSAIEGLLFLDGLHKEGIHFWSIYQQMDTRTPEGRKRFIYDVADAEYELAVISRRTKEKMAAAKRRGIHLGRPYALENKQIVEAHRQIMQGCASAEDVAARYGIHPMTMKRAFEREGLLVA